MIQPVVIKSNRYGINLILDSELPFGELLDAVKNKFQESAKFFKDAKLALSFEGRTLSPEEEEQIVEAITESSSITILCIIDNDEVRAEATREKIESLLQYDTSGENESSDGEFYHGTLRSGQVIESVSSVVVVGDVNPGAQVVSQGNIIILGALKGNACAGAAGDTGCFIVALDMDPIQIQIGDVLAKSPDRKERPKRLRRREKTPSASEAQIAVAREGNIYIEPITRDIFK